MEEPIFTSGWIRPSVELPINATKCLVTDGDVIVIATYLSEPEKSIWVFQGIDSEAKSFDIQGWMPLPKPIKKIIPMSESDLLQGGQGDGSSGRSV
jgi:hypothetical protein